MYASPAPAEQAPPVKTPVRPKSSLLPGEKVRVLLRCGQGGRGWLCVDTRGVRPAAPPGSGSVALLCWWAQREPWRDPGMALPSDYVPTLDWGAYSPRKDNPFARCALAASRLSRNPPDQP